MGIASSLPDGPSGDGGPTRRLRMPMGSLAASFAASDQAGDGSLATGVSIVEADRFLGLALRCETLPKPQREFYVRTIGEAFDRPPHTKRLFRRHIFRPEAFVVHLSLDTAADGAGRADGAGDPELTSLTDVLHRLAQARSDATAAKGAPAGPAKPVSGDAAPAPDAAEAGEGQAEGDSAAGGNSGRNSASQDAGPSTAGTPVADPANQAPPSTFSGLTGSAVHPLALAGEHADRLRAALRDGPGPEALAVAKEALTAVLLAPVPAKGEARPADDVPWRRPRVGAGTAARGAPSLASVPMDEGRAVIRGAAERGLRWAKAQSQALVSVTYFGVVKAEFWCQVCFPRVRNAVTVLASQLREATAELLHFVPRIAAVAQAHGGGPAAAAAAAAAAIAAPDLSSGIGSGGAEGNNSSNGGGEGTAATAAAPRNPLRFLSAPAAGRRGGADGADSDRASGRGASTSAAAADSGEAEAAEEEEGEDEAARRARGTAEEAYLLTAAHVVFGLAGLLGCQQRVVNDVVEAFCATVTDGLELSALQTEALTGKIEGLAAGLQCSRPVRRGAMEELVVELQRVASEGNTVGDVLADPTAREQLPRCVEVLDSVGALLAEADLSPLEDTQQMLDQVLRERRMAAEAYSDLMCTCSTSKEQAATVYKRVMAWGRDLNGFPANLAYNILISCARSHDELIAAINHMTYLDAPMDQTVCERVLRRYQGKPYSYYDLWALMMHHPEGFPSILKNHKVMSNFSFRFGPQCTSKEIIEIATGARPSPAATASQSGAASAAAATRRDAAAAAGPGDGTAAAAASSRTAGPDSAENAAPEAAAEAPEVDSTEKQEEARGAEEADSK